METSDCTPAQSSDTYPFSFLSLFILPEKLLLTGTSERNWSVLPFKLRCHTPRRTHPHNQNRSQVLDLRVLFFFWRRGEPVETPIMKASSLLACVAACVHAASVRAAVAVDVENFHVNFAQEPLRLQHAIPRLRRDMPSDESVHVRFTVNETEFDLDLRLMPSVYTNSVSEMRSIEPPAYSNEKAVFVFGSKGYVAGTVWRKEGILNIHRDVGTVKILAELRASGDHSDGKCGVHTDAHDKTHAHSNLQNGNTATENFGGRHKRAYDQWWGGGSCYPDDDVTKAATMGVAVGYQLWVELGATELAVTNFVTTVIQTSNIVVSINVIKYGFFSFFFLFFFFAALPPFSSPPFHPLSFPTSISHFSRIAIIFFHPVFTH